MTYKPHASTVKSKARSLRKSLLSYGIKDLMIEDLERMLTCGVICPYCQEGVPVPNISVDHITPRSRGGSDSIANIHLTCLACNHAKGNLTHLEFMELMDFLATRPATKKNLMGRLKASGFMFKGGKIHFIKGGLT